MWSRLNQSRTLGKRFEQFCQLIGWAEQGKTFIFYHPKMVAIDMKTWEKIQRTLNPPKKTIVYYDEYDFITPEKEAELKKWLGKLK
jgi:hypothetical protein